MSADELPAAPRLPARSGARAQRAPRVRALTLDAIAAAALHVVDEEGLDAMTMRRVAEELGTGAASLYAYVDNKERLTELVIDRALGELEPPAGDDGPWQEQLKAGLRELRALLARHGDLARASFAHIPLGENALRASEWMIATLRRGELPPTVIAYACDLLPLYVTAIAYEDSVYAGERVSPDQLAAYVAEMRSYFESLPAARFPNVVAFAAALTAGSGGDERFEFGLEVLVGGLVALAEQPTR
jgi:AcrR family transcriptional regulator